jgi:hypothetical protein
MRRIALVAALLGAAGCRHRPAVRTTRNAPAAQPAGSALPVPYDRFLPPLLGTAHVADCWLDPCVQELDLDGDGQTDYAFLVKDAKGRRGIAFALSTLPQDLAMIAGAGTSLGRGGDDFSWADGWLVHTAPHGDLLDVKGKNAGTLSWNGTAVSWSAPRD